MHDEWSWTIGVVVGPFGIRGEAKVRIETDFPDRFAKLKLVCVRDADGSARLLRVAGVRIHKGQALVKLEGVDRIEDVDGLRGSMLQVRREDLVELPSDSFYVSDIIGFTVSTEDGRELGVLEEVLKYPAHDLWRVGEALIPASRPFVRQMDVEGRRIVVSLPPGLLPGDEPEDAR